MSLLVLQKKGSAIIIITVCIISFTLKAAAQQSNTDPANGVVTKCPPKAVLIKNVIDFADGQISGMLSKENTYTRIPKTTGKDGSLLRVNMYDWGSGFFAGILWNMYELTNEIKWQKEAIKWTEALEPIKTYSGHHDVGFIMYNSYGHAYRLTKNENYKAILIQTAQSLASRYNSKVGLIKSWNYKRAPDGKSTWYYPVIIDNLMNLELLFFASKVSGNPSFKTIAVSHAENTMKNHIRPDYSSYHVVDYDSATGAVNFRGTRQGLSDNSTWARGQAWGIYGFTMIYRETKDKRFLKVAQKMADFYIQHPNLPKDKIPYWDYNATDTNYKSQWGYDQRQYPVPLRDASAAAITCSALIELSQYSGRKGKKYRKTAERILCSLADSNYSAKLNENNNFLLMHSVGSFPDGLEIDVPLNYADYYYLEALNRYRNLKSK